MSDVDDEANLVLPCIAEPRSDIRIRSHHHEAMLEHRAEHGLPPGKSKR